MDRARFNAEAFLGALEATRDLRKLTWKEVARQAGVSASTLTRMGQGKHPDANSLAALLAWSGLTTEDFVSVPNPVPTPDPVARAVAYLRADKDLSAETADALEKVLKATYDLVKRQQGEKK